MIWEVAGYSGSWRWYFKSVKFNQTSTGYKFGSQSYLPSPPNSRRTTREVRGLTRERASLQGLPPSVG
jgi:hypothetical protein